MRPPLADRRAGRTTAVLGLVIAVPLLLALVALRDPPWVPVVDHTMTELRLRDTFTGHPPLVGLPGRIGTLDRLGSHPGPMSFYVMTPVYRLVGSTGWALAAAAVGVHLLAVGGALWIGYRRGGRVLAAAVGLMLVVLMVGLGARALAQPWNPYLPFVMSIVFLLAVWSVLVGDLPMLPVAAAAGAFCAQTHVSYLALYACLGALALAGAVWWAVKRTGSERRQAMVWIGFAAWVTGVLWLPPIYQQLRPTDTDPGNISILVDHFATPPEPPLGIGSGVGIMLEHLDTTYLVAQVASPGELSNDLAARPSRAVGAVVLCLWLGAAAAALAMRHARLIGLHVVVGAALVMGIVSASRIFGVPWYYLTLWLWGIAALVVLAIGWTAVVLVDRWRAGTDASGLDRRLAVTAFWVLFGIVALVAARFSFSSARIEGLDAIPSEVVGEVLPDVTSAIDAGSGAATGRDGRYLVTWSDSLNLGESGFGLFGELERRGYDVGVPFAYHTQFGAHRVLDPDDANAQIVLATGINVDEWRTVPGAIEVGFVDPRSEPERVEYVRIRGELIDSLGADDADDLVAEVDRNLFAAGLDPRLSDRSRELLLELNEFGLPSAVFIAPADAAVTVGSEPEPDP